MFHQCRSILFAFMIALWFGSVPAANAQVYDLATDWSDVNNPNGVWRLYKAPNSLFAINQPDWTSAGINQRAWADQPYQQLAHVPVWMKTTSYASNFVSAGTVIMHGAESGRTGTEFSSVTWTSPFAGNVQIAGGAWRDKSADRPMVWELRKNGTSLSTGALTQSDSYTQANPFNFANGTGGATAVNLSVSQNDTIELLIYRRSQATPSIFVGLCFKITVVPNINPRATYLHTNNDPNALNAIPLDLTALNIHPGDRLRMQAVNDFQFDMTASHLSPAMTGVFSRTDTLLGSDLLHRVSGAIAAGIPFVTVPTANGNQSTDIAEDFFVDNVMLLVPVGARYLFVAAADNSYGDNSDPHGFGIRLTVVRTVAGRVILEGANNPAQTVQMVFRSNSCSPNIVRNVPLDANGNFSLTDIPRDNYSLWIKGSKWLAKAVPVDVTIGDVTNVAVTLKAGDANNDNVADIGDLLLLVAHYNTASPASGYLEACDFNEDGSNDIFDLLLLIANYNQQGDS